MATVTERTADAKAADHLGATAADRGAPAAPAHVAPGQVAPAQVAPGQVAPGQVAGDQLRSAEPAGPAPAPSHRRLGRAGRIPGLVWLVTAVWGLLMALGTIVWPATYGLDESAHIDMAYAYATDARLYDPGTLGYSQAVTKIQAYYVGHPLRRTLAEASLPARGARPSLDQLGSQRVIGRQTSINQMTQHPPAYYALCAVVLKVPGVSSLAFDQQIGLMRLVSLLCMLPVPLLAWATARALRLPDWTALAAAVVPLGVPGLLRTGSVVNNDALLVLATSVLLWLLARVLSGDLRRRTAAGIAVALAVALLTKGLALVLPPIVGVAYLVAWRKQRRFPVLPLLIAAAGGVVGGLWWLRNLVRFGVVQPNGFGPDFERTVFGPPTNIGHFDVFLPTFTNAFFVRAWAGLGIPDTPAQPPVLVWAWLILVAIGVVAALSVRSPLPRVGSIALVAPFVLSGLVVASQSWTTYQAYGRLAAVQGRYAYLGIAGLAVVAVLGLGQLLLPRYRLRLPVVLFGLAMVTEAAAVYLIAGNWFHRDSMSAFGRAHEGFAAMLRLSPWPAPLTVLPFLAVVLLAPVGLVLLARSAGSRAAGDDLATAAP